MRVVIKVGLSEYEFRSWATEPLGFDGERVRSWDVDEARAMLRWALTGHSVVHLRPLVLECLATGRALDVDGLLDQLARLVVSGQVIVERRAIELLPSDAPDVQIEYEPAPPEAIEEDEFVIVVDTWMSPDLWVVVEDGFDPPPNLHVEDGSQSWELEVFDEVEEVLEVWTSSPEPEPEFMIHCESRTGRGLREG